MSFLKGLTTAAFAGAVVAGAARADELVTADIATSTTWTADKVYNLQTQIYVLPGATLTIEPGTVIASDTGIGGSLAVTQGAQLIVNGTQNAPVVMTSKADQATWTAGDPRTGTWRATCQEWGNLTIMGRAYISEDATPGNTAVPSPTNVATMEGLVPPVAHPEYAQYGGGDDDDDSGTISYLSLRYGGKVLAVNNELNGLSLGGIGRGTDIHHLEIMNNVDDGIEIWGGTVNLKYFSIWNIGDDSFDVDQGWRGKAQFGFIVQGYSCDNNASGPQGSGIGDNCFETDGAEQSHYQPVTTASIWNCTVIGEPVSGDHGTAWRDNARVQYNSCIFMDLGDRLVSFDNIDGDGGAGYGFNGTLSWADTWTTDYSVTSTVNPFAAPGTAYQSQTSGKLAQITDSVMFRATKATAYDTANTVGVFAPANNNVNAGSLAADMPIKSLVRQTPIVLPLSGITMAPVATIDPRAANAALASVSSAPADGFFTPVGYRGAFGPTSNWLCGWSAADAFGFLSIDAVATIRSDALNLSGAITPIGLPSLGNSSFGFSVTSPGTCGVVAPQLAISVVSVGPPTTFPWADGGCGGGVGTALVNPFTYLPDYLQFTPWFGSPVTFAFPIGDNASLCGARFTSQAAFLSLTTFAFTWGDAVDCQVGH